MRLGVLLSTLLILAGNHASGNIYGFTGSWPRGFRVLCQDHPEQCQIRAEAKPINYLQWESTIEDTNRAVNHSIKYRPDVVDHFDDSPEWGDCDDYALTKRDILLKRGFDPSTVLFLYAHLHGFEVGDDHIVLVVRTNYGLKVMDNLHDGVYDLGQMMVDWAYMEGTTNPKNWRPIESD
jgi:predicted transglutaminase-like cysteine proteinase